MLPAIMTCLSLVAVDGDTVRCDGLLLRLLGDGMPYVSGIDTPEIRNRKCAAELALGQKAKQRLAGMIKDGVVVEVSGSIDPLNRPLVRLRLPDRRTAGAVLLKEGLARQWLPTRKNNWCD